MNDDTISRQAAIDALVKRTHLTWEYLKTIYPMLDVLEKLPAAEPEIIRCKDCKHRDTENGLCEGRGWPMQLVPDDGFCDKGERRTDGR